MCMHNGLVVISVFIFLEIAFGTWQRTKRKERYMFNHVFTCTGSLLLHNKKYLTSITFATTSLEYMQALDDLNKTKKELEDDLKENKDQLEVTQKMLKGTRMELERERQKKVQKHEDSRQQGIYNIALINEISD